MVAIERVSTMQLFFREAIMWLTSHKYLPHRQRQLMMLKIVSKLHNTHVLETRLVKQQQRETLGEYRYGTDKRPSKG